MKTPWLSVIIPTYNGATYLSAALDSILLQNDKNIECIAIDDGSSDATLSILEKYRHKTSIHVHQRRRGSWVANTNFALSLAQGEYISYLHQDDIWLNNRLEILRTLTIESPDAGLIIHPALFIDETGKPVGMWKCPLPAYPVAIDPQLLRERLLTQNFISVPGTLFKRSIVLDAGSMDEALWYTADWDLWLKIAASAKAIYFPRPLSGFRVHSNSQTVKRSFDENEFREQMNTVLLRHFKEFQLSPSRKKEILDTALFSIEVNTKLAMRIHGKRINFLNLFLSFLSLGISGWHRYLRDSRILERALARMKANALSKSW